MSDEKMTFAGDATPLLNEMLKVKSRQIELEQQIKANAKAAHDGHALAIKAMVEDEVETFKLTQKKQQLTRAIADMGAQVEKLRNAPPLQLLSHADVKADQERLRTQQEHEIAQKRQAEMALMFLNQQQAGLQQQQAAQERTLSGLAREKAMREELNRLRLEPINVKTTVADVKVAQVQAEYSRLGQQIDVVTRRIQLMQQAGDGSSIAFVKDIEKERVALAALQRQQMGLQSQLSMTSRGMGNAGMIAQQLAFAVDDAAQSFGTGGLTGALRGAGNNLSMVMMMMGGPMIGTLTGVGVAIAGSVVTNLERWMKENEKLKEALPHQKAYADAWREIGDRIAKATLSQKEYVRVEGEARVRRQVAPIEEERKKAKEDVVAAAAEVAQIKQNLANLENGWGAWGGNQEEKAALNDKLAKREQELGAAQIRVGAAEKKIMDIRRGEADAQKAEEAAAGRERLKEWGKNINRDWAQFQKGIHKGLGEAIEKRDPRQIEMVDLRRRADDQQRAVQDLREEKEGIPKNHKKPRREQDVKIDEADDKLRVLNRRIEDLQRQLQREKDDRERLQPLGAGAAKDPVERLLEGVRRIADGFLGGEPVRHVDRNGNN